MDMISVRGIFYIFIIKSLERIELFIVFFLVWDILIVTEVMSGPSPLILSSVIPEVVASVFYSKNSIASITNPGYNIANRYIGLEVVLDVPARVFGHSLFRECICFIEVRYHSNLNYTALKHECVSICPHWTHYYRTSFSAFFIIISLAFFADSLQFFNY